MASAKQQPLGALVVHHLRATTSANDWDPQDLAHIQEFLLYSEDSIDANRSASATAQALRRWLDTIPEEAATRIDTMLPQEDAHFLACLIPPLCIWAQQNAWGQSMDVSTLTQHAIELLNENTGTPLDQIGATQAAARVLRDTVPLARSHDSAWNLVVPWVWVLSSHHLLWPSATGLWDRQRHLMTPFTESWMATGEAAMLVDEHRQKDTKSIPLVERWYSKIRSSMQLLNSEEQTSVVARTMSVAFSSAVKLSVCRLAGSIVWVDPVVQRTIANLLPVDEMERLGKLPWFSGDGQANRRLAFAYAPSTAALLDGLGDANVWENARQYGAMLKALADANASRADAAHAIDGTVFDNPERV